MRSRFTRPERATRRCACTHRLGLESLEARSLPSSAGSLDTTFGSGGIVTTAFSSGSNAEVVTLQSDGKIIVAGESSDSSGTNDMFTVARYTANGALDTSFGNGGSVSLNLVGGRHTVHLGGATVDAAGRIVLAGSSSTGKIGTEDLVLARLTSSGSLDTTFGSKGKVLTPVSNSNLEEIDALAIQPDGKIVVAGWGGSDAVLARYNPNGSLDSAFGSGGLVTTLLGGAGASFHALTLQANGEILAGGTEWPTNTPDSTGGLFAVARYNPNGTPDTTFGSGGIVTTAIAGNCDSLWDTGVHAVLVQSDGAIVAVGSVLNGAGPSPSSDGAEIALIRYAGTGSLDPTFGTGGVTVTATPGSDVDFARAAALQSDGSIVVAGEHSDTTTGQAFEVERYTAAGVLDPTFNGTGVVTTAIGSAAGANAVVIQPNDGKIVVAGGANVGGATFAVARYLV